MNNDRLKFRTPYYLPNPDGINEFVGFAYWDATTGRPNMMVVWGNDEQCTGLRDKNGNLIYENDVLSDGQNVGYVYWDNSGWACTSFLSKKLSELEIIGNIHEQKDKQ